MVGVIRAGFSRDEKRLADLTLRRTGAILCEEVVCGGEEVPGSKRRGHLKDFSGFG